MLLPPSIVVHIHDQGREDDVIVEHRFESDERHGISELPIPIIYDDQDIQVRLGVAVATRFGTKQNDAHYLLGILLLKPGNKCFQGHPFIVCKVPQLSFVHTAHQRYLTKPIIPYLLAEGKPPM